MLLFAVFFIASNATALPPYDASYTVEMHQGPVIGAANILGMGGAYIGIAEGAGAQLFNPAAVANRNGINGGDFFDWDFSLDGLSPGAAGIVTTDLEPPTLRGATAKQTEIGSGAFEMLFGRLGVGLLFNDQTYHFCMGDLPCAHSTTQYSAITLGLQGGYSYLDGTLVLGVGLGFVSARFTLPNEREQRRFAGLQGEAGLLFRPPHKNLRIGAAWRSGSTLQPRDAWPPLTRVVLPRTSHAPWQTGVGVAFSIGERPINRVPTFGGPGYVNLTPPTGWWRDGRVDVDVVVEGASHHAVSISSWAGQVAHLTGVNPTVTVRAGVESEFWPSRMRARLGSYYEPARTNDASGRLHGTGGVELRLFKFIWQWRVGAAADGAREYFNAALSLGFWQ